MNLALRLKLQDHLNNGVVSEFLLRKSEHEKAIKVLPLQVFKSLHVGIDNVHYRLTSKDLIECDIFHYFDLVKEDDYNFLEFNIENYLNPMSKDRKFDFLEKWEYDSNKKRVVISHKNCQDGAGVVAVVKHHSNDILKNETNIFEDIEYIYLDYNSFDFQELKSNLVGKLVYVGDFSFKDGQLEELEEVVEDIVTVDHHKGVFDNPSFLIKR